MPRGRTFKETRERIAEVHGDRISLDPTSTFSTSKDRARFICSACHRSFEKTICKVLDGEGCPHCSKRPRYTTATWTEEARRRRGDEFDYSRTVYTNARGHVELIHRRCGNVVWQQAASHLRNAGCQFCGGNARRGRKGLLEDSARVHGVGKFEFLSEYSNNRTHVLARCSECLHEFKTTPGNHVHRGSGCPKCAEGNVSEEEIAWLDSLNIPQKCRQVTLPGTRYRVDALVDNVVYEFNGSFWHGDPRVHPPSDVNERTSTTFGELYERTLAREDEIRSLGYDLNVVWELDWRNTRARSEFDRNVVFSCSCRWSDHLRLDECPRCGPRASSVRRTFQEYLTTFGSVGEHSDRSFRIGERHVFFLDAPWRHVYPDELVSRSQVERETIGLISKGSDVSRFYEDEWLERKPVVRSVVEHALGRSPRRVGARSCDIVELSVREREEFFGRCHLEGDVTAIVAFGLRRKSDGLLVAAMSLRDPFHRKAHAGKVELARFACELGTAVPGALSRLVKRARSWAFEGGYSTLMTYADGRLGNGDGYERVGFSRIKRGGPRLWWTDLRRRRSRFSVRADPQNGRTQRQRAIDEGVVEMRGCANVTFEMPLR